MTDISTQKMECKRKPSAIFAQRYRERARNQKQQFEENLQNLEKANAYLKLQDQKYTNIVAYMKNYVQYMKKNNDSNLNEPQLVAPDFKGLARVLDNNNNNNAVQTKPQYDHNHSMADSNFNIPNFLMDEENISSPVQPEVREDERIQLINKSNRTHEFDFLDNLPMDLDEKSQSTHFDQNLVDLSPDLNIDSVCENNPCCENISMEEQFNLNEIYDILPKMSLSQNEINNLEIMKIEELLKAEAVKHGYRLYTTNSTIENHVNGYTFVNHLLDPNKQNFVSYGQNFSTNPHLLPVDESQHDEMIDNMLTDDHIDVDFEFLS